MKELVIEADVKSLDEVLDFINEELERADCPPKTQIQIDIAVEELYVNIAHYAYTPDVGNATIIVDVKEEEPRSVSITFVDRGFPYNPLMKPDPDITLPIDERKIGGLGIYMVKKSMDNITYEYRDGQNILTIEKNL